MPDGITRQGAVFDVVTMPDGGASMPDSMAMLADGNSSLGEQVLRDFSIFSYLFQKRSLMDEILCYFLLSYH